KLDRPGDLIPPDRGPGLPGGPGIPPSLVRLPQAAPGAVPGLEHADRLRVPLAPGIADDPRAEVHDAGLRALLRRAGALGAGAQLGSDRAPGGAGGLLCVACRLDEDLDVGGRDDDAPGEPRAGLPARLHPGRAGPRGETDP